MKDFILRNRYSLLLVVLAVYVLVLVVEGALTGREARVFEFDNPFFDLNVNNWEEFVEENRDVDL